MKYLLIILFSFNVFSQWIEKSVTYTGNSLESSYEVEKETEFRVLKAILGEKLKSFNLDPLLLWQAMEKKYQEDIPLASRNITQRDSYYKLKDYLSSLVNVNRSRSGGNSKQMTIAMKGLVDSSALRSLYTQYVLSNLRVEAQYETVALESEIFLFKTDWDSLGVRGGQIVNLKEQVRKFWKQWLEQNTNLKVVFYDPLREAQGRVAKVNVAIRLNYKRFNQALNRHVFETQSSVTGQDLFSKDFIFYKDQKVEQRIDAVEDNANTLAQLIYGTPLNEFTLLTNIMKKETATSRRHQLTISGYKNYGEFQVLSEKIVNSYIMNAMKARIKSYSKNKAEMELSFSGNVDWMKIQNEFARSHPHISVQ